MANNEWRRDRLRGSISDRSDEVLCVGPKHPSDASVCCIPDMQVPGATATNDMERARAVVDYIAMLTDAQLHSLSRALSAAGPPSTLYFV
jgi:hypothetical protein